MVVVYFLPQCISLQQKHVKSCELLQLIQYFQTLGSNGKHPSGGLYTFSVVISIVPRDTVHKALQHLAMLFISANREPQIVYGFSE